MAAHNFKDLTGQRFGKWTVLYRDIEYENLIKQRTEHSCSAYWKCQCECGTLQTIVVSNLTTGKTKQCKKCRQENTKTPNNFIDITGKKFNSLTVIKRDDTVKFPAKWICKCDCGNVTSVLGTEIRSGHTRSCGCLQKESARQKLIDLTGQKFGKLTVIERAENRGKRTCWKCKCECGNYTTVDGIKLISNHTSSCGCIKSYGEYVVKTLLQNQNIDYLSNVNFFNLKGEKGYKLKFDFIVNPNDNPYIIEIDGEQHFGLHRGIFNDKDRYNQIHINDMIKNNYCFDNNIILIRIPTKEINNITLVDLLPGSKFEVNRNNIDDYYIKFIDK